MDTTLFIQLLKEMLMLIVLLSSPVLVSGMVVGTLIGVAQTVTQVQEQTLTFVPKVVIGLGVLMLTAPWTVDQLINHAQQMFELMITLAQQDRSG
jgi:flagellar biosynthetic protein FliQ